MERASIKIFLFLAALLTGADAYAQQQTLISGKVEHGGFGGPVIKVTSIDQTATMLFGARGGWIINFAPDHTFVLGGGGYGMVDEQRKENLILPGDRSAYLNMNYGGLEMEYVNRTNRLIHLSVQLLLGAGEARYVDQQGERVGGDAFEDSFFVAEPGVNLLVNLTTFMRAGLGLHYRYAGGVELPLLDDSDFSSLSGALTFKFGSF